MEFDHFIRDCNDPKSPPVLVNEDALRAAVVNAKRRAATVGPLHALWDAIFDAEALLKGSPTVRQFDSRDQGIIELYRALTSRR